MPSALITRPSTPFSTPTLKSETLKIAEADDATIFTSPPDFSISKFPPIVKTSPNEAASPVKETPISEVEAGRAPYVKSRPPALIVWPVNTSLVSLYRTFTSLALTEAKLPPVTASVPFASRAVLPVERITRPRLAAVTPAEKSPAEIFAKASLATTRTFVPLFSNPKLPPTVKTSEKVACNPEMETLFSIVAAGRLAKV